MNYTYQINVKNNEIQRASFNQLTRENFCFDFADWYARGYWGTKYIPHVLLDGDKVIANVSVNELDFVICGEKKKLIQLGTVMTAAEYRMQGLGKQIMDRVLEEYAGKVDGVYLFGNDSVLEYYPRFGFKKYEQFQYYRRYEPEEQKTATEQTGESCLRHVDMSDEMECSRVLQTIKANVSDDKVLMFDNSDLDMFYLSGPSSENVYEIPSEKAFVILEQEENQLGITQIFADHEINTARILETVCREYEGSVSEISLGFSPAETDGWLCRRVVVEDCTFWGMGDIMKLFEDEKLMFPILSHA